MAADPNKLAIFVTSPQNMTHVIGLAEATVRAGKKPMIFFTFKSIGIACSVPAFMMMVNIGQNFFQMTYIF